MHLFAPEQPDLNWDNPSVRREYEDILRFWLDRGAAGIRIDSAALLVKDPELREVQDDVPSGCHPYIDRDDLHDIYKSWRAVADSYAQPRVLIGELWLEDTERFTNYLSDDELHMAFNFDFLTCAWETDLLRASIDRTLTAHASVDAPATWLLSNHDVTRPVTRYGREDSSFSFAAKKAGVPADLELGRRRARAGALLAMALPGVFYFYQGEELGLPEVEDIPVDRVQDPMYFRSRGRDPGRDGCRVPLPWSGVGAPYGFSPGGARREPWLPQPPTWQRLTVDAQDEAADSTLNLYRNAVRVRRDQLVGRDAAFAWIDPGTDSGASVLAFRRGEHFGCIVNLGDAPIHLPPGHRVLLASDPLDRGDDGDLISPDTAVWHSFEP
jgi:alpha-glucosidase